MTWMPLTNYTGYEHVLNAIPCCVHPINGTLYGCAIEKRGDIQQDLSIYRVRRGATERELVKRFLGGKDADTQIAMGGCMLLQDGSLEVWASLDPIGASVTKTGFQGMWTRLPGIDAPWGGADIGALAQHLADVEAVMHLTQDAGVRLGWRIDAIESALGNLSSGGLDAGDRDALNRLRAMLRI
jgi:hypothetical protein